MTRQKSFKARVRARMDKTGESYTAARRQLLADSASSTTETGSRTPVRPLTRRMSDDAVRARTGRGWDEWFALLDEWGAPAHSHTEIARWLVEKHALGGWWAQSLSVGYEQERGMRTPSQHVDGAFAASASKTVNVAAERVSEAFTDPALRERWLPGARIAIRTSRPGRSLTADWNDGASRLSVYLTVQGETKTRVGLQHRRLPDAATAERMKTHWRSAFSRLAALLEA
ncbi:DUF4287 domain-containing protein [Streptomyces sp. 4N509B]|uniref:DUF4287 domain-containing protein n=1 Tax=Streptomyces sp. 4N509B TaxID=3457413 RepID=UPI003FCF5CBD